VKAPLRCRLAPSSHQAQRLRPFPFQSSAPWYRHSENSIPSAPALLRYLIATDRGIADALPAPSAAILLSSCSVCHMLSDNWAIDAINKGLAGSNRLAGFGNEVLWSLREVLRSASTVHVNSRSCRRFFVTLLRPPCQRRRECASPLFGRQANLSAVGARTNRQPTIDIRLRLQERLCRDLRSARRNVSGRSSGMRTLCQRTVAPLLGSVRAVAAATSALNNPVESTGRRQRRSRKSGPHQRGAFTRGRCGTSLWRRDRMA
jgi:hypothetical protein